WSYSGRRYRRETMEELARAYEASLRELIEHCGQEGAGGHTPSDFDAVRLEQEEVDRWCAQPGGLEDVYPLSPLQEGLLYHALEEGGEMYFGQMSCVLSGLKVEAFREALLAVIRRHTILRSEFIGRG